MKYNKPSVTRLDTASLAIQGNNDKSSNIVMDANPHVTVFSTGGAYDLDE
jgi:hypothetical protein